MITAREDPLELRKKLLLCLEANLVIAERLQANLLAELLNVEEAYL